MAVWTLQIAAAAGENKCAVQSESSEGVFSSRGG